MVKIAIIMPVYNEGKRVIRTVRNVLDNTKYNLVVVDDGSSDNTSKLLVESYKRNKRVILIRHSVNQGKGVAMRTGVRRAWKEKSQAVIFIDADGQHDPKLLKKFEESLENGDEVVIGVRIDKSEMSFQRKVGNWMIRVILAVLYGQTIEDMLCGFRALSKSAYHKVVWTSRRYGVETEMMCNVWRAGLNYRKLVVETIYAEKESQKRDCFRPRDGIKIVLLLPFWWWRGLFRHKK